MSLSHRTIVMALGALVAALPLTARAGFAVPPPPPCSDSCGEPSVPAYYTETPELPDEAGPAEPPVSVPGQRSIFGLGLFAGGVQLHRDANGDQIGLVGRMRVSRPIELELEVARFDAESRRDDHLGASLLVDLVPRARFSPFVLGGVGYAKVDVGDGAWRGDQTYAEVGAGLKYRISRQFALSSDVRVGVRGVRGTPNEGAGFTAAISSLVPSDDEDFGRLRLSGILYF